MPFRICFIGLIAFAGFIPAADKPAEGIAFPASAHVLDVTKAPYLAKGDGKTDDTTALQKALDDAMGRHKIVYLPNGTYIVSKTLRWKNQNAQKQNAYGFVWVQGQSTAKTVLRLTDATFTDATKPEPIMWCGGFGSADWFHNYVQNVTFDVGKGNPGAVGVQFYSNNTGSVRDVSVISADGQGAIGLDLGHRDMNGPLLVRNVRVSGFDTGVRCAATVNSQTFERLTLSGQRTVGLINSGQAISVRGLKYDGEATAVQADSFTVLLDGEFSGRGGAKDRPAVTVGQVPFFARNLTSSGYKTAVNAAPAAATVTEFAQGKPGNAFDGPTTSPGLTVEETPDVPWDDPATWAVAETFGADPTGGKDSSAAIQKAIDSGATTVFLPGFYQLSKPVIVRGKVRRLLGSGGWTDYLGKTQPNFVIADGDARTVHIEHISGVNGGIDVDTKRNVVVRSLGAKFVRFKQPADAFFEDVTTNDLTVVKDQKVWARQLNIENEGTHLTNAGGRLWVLGYKTERGGTLLHTTGGGTSEIFGTFSYTTTAGKLAPMFRTDDATAFAFFHEVCYTGDPFSVLSRDTHAGVTKETMRNDAGIAPYVSRPGKK